MKYLAFLAVSLWAGAAEAVPSFARQLNMSCSSCHTAYPQLTAFGRQFKALGYTTTASEQVEGKTGKRETLSIDKLPPLALALVGSYLTFNTKLATTQNGSFLFPDELSLFYAGRITPHVGAFLQLTYDAQEDHVSADNVDVRYATSLKLAGKSLIVGATLNNGPSIEDLWNSTPAWGWPFVGSGAWPGEGSNVPLVVDGLAQAVVGLGAYAFWNGAIYLEAAGYRSMQLGVAQPLSSGDSHVVKGVAPYWRGAWQGQWGRHEVLIGTYGLYGRLFPGAAAGRPLLGTSDGYLDVAGDAQYQYYAEESPWSAAVHATWIHEWRDLDASAGGEKPELNAARIDANAYRGFLGASAGLFFSIGTRTPTFGTASGRPNSTGAIVGLRFRPWLNTDLRLDYTFYTKFDGRRRNYDGSGRDASANNNLALILWLAY